MPDERLQAALTRQQREGGFYLEEDEDFVYLYDSEGIKQAVFSSKGATIESIREEADRLMKEE